MATGAYIGLDSSKKIKSLYIGIADISRKIKRAYIGVNGQARLWLKTTNIPPTYAGQISIAHINIRRMRAYNAKNDYYALVDAFDTCDNQLNPGPSYAIFVNPSGVSTELEITSFTSRYFSNTLYYSGAVSTATKIFIWANNNVGPRSISGAFMYNSSLVCTQLPSDAYSGHFNSAVASFDDIAMIIGGYEEFNSSSTLAAENFYDSGVCNHFSDIETLVGAGYHDRLGSITGTVQFDNCLCYYATTNANFLYGSRIITKDLVSVAYNGSITPSCDLVFSSNGSVAYVLSCRHEKSVGYFIVYRSNGVYDERVSITPDEFYQNGVFDISPQFTNNSYTYYPLVARPYTGAAGYGGVIYNESGVAVYTGAEPYSLISGAQCTVYHDILYMPVNAAIFEYQL